MQNTLISFALIKAIYDQSVDLLTPFYPFILETLRVSQKRLSGSEVSDELLNLFDLNIPLNTLETISKELNEQDYIYYNKHMFSSWFIELTDKGIEYLKESDKERRSIQNRQRIFFESFTSFCTNTFDNVNYSNSDFNNLVKDYIIKNIENLSFLNPDKQNDIQKLNIFDFQLTEFLLKIEHENQKLVDTFNELIRGAIIWCMITRDEKIDIKTSFDSIDIYLDSNILFSILGFHHPSINKAAIELFQLMNSNRSIQLKVLNITLNEMANLLENYKKEKIIYSNMPVHSIFYYLKHNGYTNSKIDILIDELPEKMRELGVELEVIEEVNYDKLTEEEKSAFQDLYHYKSEINNRRDPLLQKQESTIFRSSLHDYNVVSHVLSIRPNWVKSLEKCKFIFLTSSYYLSNYGQILSKQNKSFPIIIRDTILTNILWLKNPSNNIGVSFSNIINAHANEIFINNSIWREFIRSMNELLESEKINNDDYARLISKNQITLSFLSKASIDDINQDSILKLKTSYDNELSRQSDKIKEQAGSLKITLDTILEQKTKIDNMDIEIQNLKKKEREKEREKELAKERRKYVNDRSQKIKNDIKTIMKFFSAGLLIMLIYEWSNIDKNTIIANKFYLKALVDFFFFIIIPLVFSILCKKLNGDVLEYIFHKQKFQVRLINEFKNRLTK